VEWVACRTWRELSSCRSRPWRSRPSRSAWQGRPVVGRRSSSFSAAKAWSKVRRGRRRSGGASGRCAGVGTPSGSGRSALHAPLLSRTRHGFHVYLPPARFDAPPLVGSSAASVRCRRCQPGCSGFSRGRPWVAAGQRSTFRRVGTSTGSHAGSLRMNGGAKRLSDLCPSTVTPDRDRRLASVPGETWERFADRVAWTATEPDPETRQLRREERLVRLP
jgi:hypothetical protein